MSSPQNPLQALAMAHMMSQISSGQPQAPDRSQALGQLVGQQSSDLQGADPQQLARDLQGMKGAIAAMVPQTAFRIPMVTKHLGQALKAIEGAIAEATKAAVTAQTVAQPIGLQAASPSMGPAGGGMPMGGGGGY